MKNNSLRLHISRDGGEDNRTINVANIHYKTKTKICKMKVDEKATEKTIPYISNVKYAFSYSLLNVEEEKIEPFLEVLNIMSWVECT
jgi:hypothetical protein